MDVEVASGRLELTLRVADGRLLELHMELRAMLVSAM